MATLGIHVVSTAYGTWLPGQSQGHWSPLFDFYGHLLTAGGKLNLPDPATYQRSRELQKEPPKVFTTEEMVVIAKKIGEYITWPNHIAPALAGKTCNPLVYAAAIEPTHIHLLLGPVEEDLDRYVGRLKGTSSSAILKLPGNEARRRTWTAKFWRVFLFNEDALHAVKEYIEAYNLRKN
jgi:REP element-mobilizing transposase RayT